MKLMRKNYIFICALACLFINRQIAASPLHFQPHYLTTVEGLTSNYIYDIVEDNRGLIWIGGTGGLSAFDGYNVHHFTNLPIDNKGRTTTPNITQLFLDKKNNHLWIRSANYMTFCNDLNTNKFVDFTTRGDQQRTFRQIRLGPKNTTWLFQDVNGLRRIQYINGKFHCRDYTYQSGKLPHAEVRELVTTPNGGAWLSTDNGIAYISPSGQSTIVSKGFKVRRCAATANGLYLFFTSRNEVLLANGNGKILKKTGIPGEFRKIHRVTGYIADGPMVHVFTNSGTLCVDVPQLAISRSTWPNIAEGYYYGLHNGVHVVYTRKNELWLITRQGKLEYRSQLMGKNGIQNEFNHSIRVAADKRGYLYVSTNGSGLFVYDTKAHDMVQYRSCDEMPIIHVNNLNKLFVDNEDNVWLCTHGAGVVCLTVNERIKSRYLQLQHNAYNDIINSVRGIFMQNDGRLLITAGDGSNYKLDITSLKLEPQPSFKARVFSTMTDRYGHHWTGTSEDGFYIDDVHYSKRDNVNRIEFIGAEFLQQDKLGRIWIGSRNYGLQMLKATPKYSEHLSFQNYLNHDPGERTITAMKLDHNQRLWIATASGLFMIDTRKEHISPEDVNHFTPLNSPLPGFDIQSLNVIDKEVWCGVQGMGAVCCHFNNDYTQMTSCREYKVAQGLPSNNVFVLQPDKQGNIWAGTENGLAIIGRKTQNVQQFFLSQKITDNFFTNNCSYLLSDGRLLFGTMGGLLIIEENLQSANTRQNTVQTYVTNIRIDNQSFFLNPELSKQYPDFISKHQIELPYEKNSISVCFSTLNYNSIDATTYQYYLEGYDKTWKNMTKKAEAIYQRLEPGCYTFHVKALVNNKWTPASNFTIRILPPWYRSWWAYLIYICITSCIGWMIFRQVRIIYRLRQHVREEKRKAEMERQMTDYKITFFTNISHEFRTPLTIIRGMMERLKQLNKQGDMKSPLDTMQRSTDRMLRLINNLLEFRKMQQGKLQLQLHEADIVAYVQNIYMDFHETAEQKNINYDFRPQMKSIHIPFDSSYIDKIAYNLISNAFKYTQHNGTVTISIKQKDKQLNIEVSDTGIGVPQELRNHLFDRYMESSRVVKDSLGIGLTLTAELVRTHHGTISYTDNKGGGSIFTVSLPIDGSVYDAEDFMKGSALDEGTGNTEKKGYEESYMEMQAEALNEDVSVLVVEDDAEVANYVAQTISPYFRVLTASNGEEALERLETAEQPIHLIICDVLMPRMDGFELTSRIRKNELWRHIPIILLTALTEQDKYIKGINQGADLYLPKPFSPSILIAHALQLVNQRIRIKSATSEATIPPDNEKGISPTIAVGDIRDKNFLAKIDLIISNHISDDQLAVETLTEGLGIGRSKLFEKFKELMDMTPRDYILKRRMEYSMELLKDGRLSITEISYKAGFSNPPYFTRVFKKYFGATPSEYIKKTSEE